MRERIKIAILGGDMRQLAVARELTKSGFSVCLWGIDSVFCKESDDFLVGDWGEAVSGCSVLVLPLPASGDGVHVHCPLVNEAAELKLSRVLDLLPRDVLILGGRFSPMVRGMLEEKGLRYVDYFLREEFQIKNAVPTAEGAIAIAMNETPVTLSDANVAVIGYGRIGKVLANKLKLLDAKVTVAARKSSDLALASCCGMAVLPIVVTDSQSSLQALGTGYDVIFNTVPSWILDRRVVESMRADSLVIDLASAPGGIDLQAAKERGVRVIWALSLPGKIAPYTAGKIIAQTVEQILREEGVAR